MSEDKILYFPGATQPAQQNRAFTPDKERQTTLNKALAILASDQFLLIGLRPTETGSDLFTVLRGDPEEWRKMRPHLGEALDRLYQREGI